MRFNSCYVKKILREIFEKSLYIFFLCLLSCSPRLSNYSYIRVVEVIDGDTVILENGQHLRLIGIDTPETRRREGNRWVFRPQPFSLEAKTYTQSLLKGKEIRIEFDVEKKDKYGRLLGYIFLDGRFINKLLLQEGYAVLYTRPPNVRYVEDFIKAQRMAQRLKKGLWGAYQVITPEETERFIGQIRTVRGKVLSTRCSKKACFLNFGRDYKTDFTVVIFKESIPFFSSQGIDIVSYYKGKTVEVSGRIRRYNGPEIIVNIPEEITILDNF